ncbi:MAG: Calcineurin-like phosphoesterase [Actinomycetia bacterium]|nr:Calcineurin-like phosphoesterase [Actinomycetes bacterium]
MGEIRNAELMTVGPDELVVFAASEPGVSLTTRVGDRERHTTGPHHVIHFDGLEPDTEYPLVVEGAEPAEYLPQRVRTLARPSGALLATFATTNDVHFGETVCGAIGGGHEEVGPILTAAPGDRPYPEVMSRAAIEEINRLDPDAVLVKGDLTDQGTEIEYRWFLDAYSTLGPRMRHMRGNHDAMRTTSIASGETPFAIELPGVTLAVLDTVVPGADSGQLDAGQLAWLDDLARGAANPVLVFGHHHPWEPGSEDRNDDYFGIHPDGSEGLVAVIARNESIAGYFAGHTHRNRVRHFDAARGVPIVEVSAAKDYPGAWAEYRVYEGGYTQMVRRIAAPEALDWTDRTREMFLGLYRDYALGALADRCFTWTF